MLAKRIIFILLCLLIANYVYSQKKVKIGAFNFYPAIFQDSDGVVKGFYVDAFKEIQQKENLEIEYVFGTWREGLDRIKNEEIDVLVSVAYTEARALFMDYSSVPQLTVWGEVYVDNSSEIDGILSLDQKTIAIMKSDINGLQLKTLTEKLSINCKFIETTDFEKVFELVMNKEVDAGVVNNTFGVGKSNQFNLRSSGIVLNPFDIFLTVKKNKNQELLQTFNSYLENWRYDANSIFNTSRQKWSHDKLGTIQVFPKWFKQILIAIAIVITLLIVFVILLRFQVQKATLKVIKSETLFKTFMENTTAFVYIKDESLNHLYVNHSAEVLFPSSHNKEFSSAKTIFDEKTVEILEAADRKILNLETSQIELIYLCVINNQKRWLHDYKFQLLLPNEKPAIGGVAFDITEIKEIEQNLLVANELTEIQKKELKTKNEEYESINEELNSINQELILAKEKAEESDKLKTEFINNMSHEIRTPMNGILGFTNFLKNENLSPEKRKNYIEIIQNSGNQLMRIIDDILEISRLETKQVKLLEEEVCLNDLLLEHFSIFDIKAKENKTPLYLKKGLSDIESTILTDIAKLAKILSNLLENALKFTNRGFIEFGYIVKNDNLEIYVKDTGIGINSEKQDTIFARFSQEEKELSKNVGGLGLGLSIAKENAELLGGRISLQSEKGIGSTFFVTIPYKKAN